MPQPTSKLGSMELPGRAKNIGSKELRSFSVKRRQNELKSGWASCEAKKYRPNCGCGTGAGVKGNGVEGGVF